MAKSGSVIQDQSEDKTIYQVVMNQEEQYSIWPVDLKIPLGWKEAGPSGLKADCLDYVNKVWTDMRPLSLRKKMEAFKKEEHKMKPLKPLREDLNRDTEDDLVKRLSTGEHPVEISLRPKKSLQSLRQCIERGFVYIKFTNTRGGTELGIKIDENNSDWKQMDSGDPTGHISLVGDLVLNYTRVQCVAEIDLGTFKGTGYLDIYKID